MSEKKSPNQRQEVRHFSDLVGAYSLSEARSLVNLPDYRFFQNLQSETSEWRALSPNTQLRLEIDHYLKTAELSRKDTEWILSAPGRMTDYNHARYQTWLESLKICLNQSSLTVDWSLQQELGAVSSQLKDIVCHQDKMHTSYWATSSLLEDSLKDGGSSLQYRLELNPELEYQISGFRQLMQQAEQLRLVVLGSTLNRYFELRDNLTASRDLNIPLGAYPLQSRKARLRTDGIILMTTEKSVDQLIDCCLDIYQSNFSRFRNRQSGGLLAKIAPGIAISDTRHHVAPNQYEHAKLLSAAISNCVAKSAPYQTIEFDDLSAELVKLAQEKCLTSHNLAFYA